MNIMAIDPGAKGAIVCSPVIDGKRSYCIQKMPDTIKDLWEFIECQQEAIGGFVAVLEDVGYHVQGNNASASCKFARHVGHLEMALTAEEIPFISVRPQKWMKHFGVLPKEKADRKRKIKDLMQRRFPCFRVTLDNADALGILTWAIETGAASHADTGRV